MLECRKCSEKGLTVVDDTTNGTDPLRDTLAEETSSADGTEVLGTHEGGAADDAGTPEGPSGNRSNLVLTLVAVAVLIAVVVVGYFVLMEITGQRQPQTMAEAAIETLKIQLEADPSDMNIYFQLADEYYRIGAYEEALSALDDLRSLEVTGYPLAMALYGTGRIEQAQGNMDAAIEAYLNALEVDPENSDAVHGLATLYASVGRTEDAIASYEEYVLRMPHDAGALRDLGALYEDRGDPEKALEVYRQAITFMPDDPDLAAAIARLEGQ